MSVDQPEAATSGGRAQLAVAIVEALPTLVADGCPARPVPVLIDSDRDPRSTDPPEAGDVTAAARVHLATRDGVEPGTVTDDAVQADISRLRRLAEDKGKLVTRLLTQYAALFQRLAVPPSEVERYFRVERQQLACLYFEARELPPSRDTLLRRAYRLALDARQPITGDLGQFESGPAGDGWRIGVHSRGRYLGTGFPPPGGYITALSPLAPHMLGCLQQGPMNTAGLTDWIERQFGRRPERPDTLEVFDGPDLCFAVNDEGVLELWVRTTKVTGIHRKDEQRLLRFFCENPGAKAAGNQLKSTLSIKNPAQAAGRVQEALGRVADGGGEWFLTDPLRWANGVTVRPRPPESSPSQDNRL